MHISWNEETIRSAEINNTSYKRAACFHWDDAKKDLEKKIQLTSKSQLILDIFNQSIEIGAGISVGDMGQSNFLVSLVIAKIVFPSFIFGICMHSMIKSIFVPTHKNLMELLNSNLIGVLSVRILIRKHCTVRSVKSNVRRVLPYLLF